MAKIFKKNALSKPRGFIDLEADTLRHLETMLSSINRSFELCGFEPLQQPIIDFSASLGKFLPDQDRPNEGVFSFQDDDEQWLSLRYDLTAPLARFVAENYERLPKPYRSYRSGWVFRDEKPGPARFRQFMQCDADTVGVLDVAADADMIMMMASFLEELGFSQGEYRVKINHRKLLDGLLQSLGLNQDDEQTAKRKLIILRAIDKLDKFGIKGVIDLLGKGRWDGEKEGEGDFTRGADLESKQIDIILSHIAHETEVSDFLSQLGNEIDCNATSHQALKELEKIHAILKGCDYTTQRVLIDTSVVRGLEYYTGPVYESELLSKIPNQDGTMIRCGSVSGGGRYDGLISRFKNEPVPATGFSIGVSRLLTALKNTGKLETPPPFGPVLVLRMSQDPEGIAQQHKIVFTLRQAGIRAEPYLGEASMKTQIKYANRRNAPCIVIQGENEKALHQMQIKDLVEGLDHAQHIQDNKEWRENNPGQKTIPEDKMLETIQKILQKQKERQK